MTRVPVDRGLPLSGLQETLRDHRVPFNVVRALQNYRLPDKRLRRRRGFEEYSAGRYHGNQLAKQTPSHLGQAIRLGTGETAYTREPVWNTPHSYGVIKHHDDFQPKVGRDWTVEFLLTLGEEEPLVEHDPAPSTVFATSSGFNRLAPTINGINYHFLPRRAAGVFVYDQCIIANDCIFDEGTGSITLPTDPDSAALASPSMFDCVALPALSIAYNKALDGGDAGKVRFEVEWSVLDSATSTYHLGGLAGFIQYAHEAYVAGNTYHVAVTYDTTDYKVRLYIDGVLKATSNDVRRGLGANAKWAGEADFLNGDIDRAIKRDIVLLNECTVRGNYASTCSFLNRGHRVSTLVGDWTYSGANNEWWIALNGKMAPQAVWAHDRAPALPVGKGVSTTYLTYRDPTTNPGDWRHTFGTTDRVYIRTTGAVPGFDPATLYKEVEIIFDFIGSPNLIPHTTYEYISSGGNTVAISQPNPWACSPSRGTALSELRFWHETRDAASLLAHKLHPISIGGNLKGYWRLKEGNSVLVDKVDGKKLSIHHGPPAWVKDEGLLGGLGISLADGQHLIHSMNKADGDLYIDDIHTYMDAFLYHHQGTAYTVDVPTDSHADFTAMQQIRTPHSYQQDLSRHADVVIDKGLPLFDAGNPRSKVYRAGDEWGINGVLAQDQGHRQTLFSVEGTVKPDDPFTVTAYEQSRVRLIHGWLDENGYVRFDQMARYHNGASGHAQQYQLAAGKSKRVDAAPFTGGAAFVNRFTSAGAFTAGDDGKLAVVQFENGEVIQVSRVTFVDVNNVDLEYYWAADPVNADTITIFEPLDEKTVYTITCRKKTENRGGIGASVLFNTWMDIFIDGTLMISGRCARSAFVLNERNYDVIIGASHVNDILDASVSAEFILRRQNYQVSGTQTLLSGTAPWPLNHSNQHFMTHHGDEPGDFILGFFRFWAGVGVSDEMVSEVYGNALETKYHSVHLVYNIELDQLTGTEVPNRCRYPALFQMGYKTHGGTINDFLDSTVNPDAAHVYLGWEGEDRLGYIPQPANFDNEYGEASGRMLAPFNSTLRQQGGVVALFDDCLLFDRQLSGSFASLYLPLVGLMADFSASGHWEGVVIGDRTIMVGQGGLPKVFNGRVATRAGMGRWTGGHFRGEVETDGKLKADSWYQLRIVYHDDYDQLQAVSPPIMFKTTATKKQFKITNVPQHPDPRITSIRIYATPGLVSYELARAYTPQLTKLGAIENQTYSGGDSGFTYGDTLEDDDLYPQDLVVDVIPIPIMTTATSHNGRLVGAGNPLVPDAYFWSEPGNPELFRFGNVAILEEGTGDRIVKVVSAFGSIFVFKTNSVWRLDETQPGFSIPFVQTPLVQGMGAVSARAVTVHVDPDTGRSFIFFWSKHGPYIFDGVNFIYIGQPLEKGLDDLAWDWIDTESTFVIHDINEREIITFAQLADGDRNDVAYAFNYRFSNFEQREFIWSEYTGMVGEVGLTLLATDDVSLTAHVLPGGGVIYEPMVLNYEDRFFPLIAGRNGKVYKWGNSDYDGHPKDAGTYTGFHLVAAYVADVVTVLVNPGWGSMRGLWATIIKLDLSDYYIWPIRASTANQIAFDTDYGTRPWDPSIGDFVLIGTPPAKVQFPWDMLGIPFKNKQVHRFLLWYEKDHYWRWARDWLSTWENTYTPLVDNLGKRAVIDFAPSPSLEVIKLELVSFAVDSRVDSYGYIMTPTDAEDIPQA